MLSSFSRCFGTFLLLSVTAACTASKLSANAQARLTGQVLDEAGSAVSGAQLALFKEGDLGEVAIGATLAVGTLGLACLTAQSPTVCAPIRKGLSGADGRFTFTLKGRDTQGTLNNADNFDLVVVKRRSGLEPPAVASLRFRIQRAQLQLPALRLWDGQLTLDSNGRATWPALPADYGGSPSYALRFNDSSGRGVVWSVPHASSGQRVDLRLLEDRSGTAEVDASVSLPGPDTTFTATYDSRGTPFSRTVPPPSRGAPCLASTASGQVAALHPCKLTDGDFFTPAQVGAGSGSVDTAAYVDLGSSRSVALVVARGGGGPVTLDTSSDAQTWTFYGIGSGLLVDVASARRVVARYVRLRTTNNVDIGPLAEISVWTS
jgi:hypothetical protein